MKTATINKDFRITIPRHVCVRLDIKPGDKIDITANDYGILTLAPAGAKTRTGRAKTGL